MSRVAVVRCSSYETSDVSRAVARGIDLIGGAGQFARRGETILLKPNLLIGRDAERGVTTHPSVFRAVAEALRTTGATLVYGDSPAVGTTEMAAGPSGIAAVARELGIEPADMSSPVDVPYPAGRLIKQFTIARGALDVDGIVSIPKMKTHGLTRITGAIKNQYGCIPGLLKAEFHARLANVHHFSRMLVDLNGVLRPRLYVMDGIVAMEGNGPQSGTLRPMNAILLSDDPVALDATFARLVHLEPQLVLPIVYGEQVGLGSAHGVDVVGDPIDGFIAPDFLVDRTPRADVGNLPQYGVGVRVFRHLVVPRPVIRPARCTRCGMCVGICPVTPKAVDFLEPSRARPPAHIYSRCIRCYCCQEICPEGAIDIVTPLLGRLIRRGS